MSLISIIISVSHTLFKLSGRWARDGHYVFNYLGPMGSVHIQTSGGNLVYNIPYLAHIPGSLNNV